MGMQLVRMLLLPVLPAVMRVLLPCMHRVCDQPPALRFQPHRPCSLRTMNQIVFNCMYFSIIQGVFVEDAVAVVCWNPGCGLELSAARLTGLCISHEEPHSACGIVSSVTMLVDGGPSCHCQHRSSIIICQHHCLQLAAGLWHGIRYV